MSLSDLAVRKAKPKLRGYKIFDGEGLYVWVTPTGRKYWRLKYRLQGIENVFSIGRYPEVTLAEARDEKIAARRLVRQGLSPRYEKDKIARREKELDENRFILVAGRWFLSKLNRWKYHHAEDVWFSLENHIFPYLENTLITKLDEPLELLKILKKVEVNGSYELTKKLHQRLKAIFAHAVAEGRIKHNPVTELKSLLKTHKKENFAHLRNPDELPELVHDIRSYRGNPITGIALSLSLYWFLRPGTVRILEWDHIDWLNRQMNLPPEVMKTHIPLIVPLADQTMNLLNELRQYSGHSRYLFCQANNHRKYMSENTVNTALIRMGYKGRQTAHGFRHIASTQLNEMGYRFDLIEKQLGHEGRDEVRATYNKADWLPERAAMMQAWADYIDTAYTAARLTQASVLSEKAACG